MQEMITSLDADKSGTIDFQEFCRLMEAKLAEDNPPTEESLKAAFKVRNAVSIHLRSRRCMCRPSGAELMSHFGIPATK